VSARHEPVLVAEVLHFLRNGPGLYLDATLGEGGHAEALLDAEPGARLLGCDRDPEALASSRDRLRRFGDRVTFAHATFSEIPAHCPEAEPVMTFGSPSESPTCGAGSFPAQLTLPWIVFVTTSFPSVSRTVLSLNVRPPLTVFRMKPCQNPL